MPTLVLLWVWFCAYLNCAGWALSALHQLNARGYAVVHGAVVRRVVGLAQTKFSANFPASSPAKIFPPFPKTISARIFDSGGDGFSRRRDLCANQLRRAGVSRAARVALAGGGPMALDPHVFSAHQQPFLRHRMGFRAVHRAAAKPTGCCFSSMSFPFCCCRGWCSACSRGSACGGAWRGTGCGWRRRAIVFCCRPAASATTVRRGVRAGGGGLRAARKNFRIAARFFCVRAGGRA